MFDIDWQLVAQEFLYDPKSPMIFSTGVFLVLFLVFSAIYYGLSRRDTLRIFFVTLFSYYFYYKSSGFYFVLLAIVTCGDFLLAQAIHRQHERRHSVKADGTLRHTAFQRFLLIESIALDLGLLAYFKYTNFFGQIIASFTGAHFDLLDIFLPVGISFFTFQSLSYTIDVYRGQLKPVNRLLDYAFYVSFFPQLVAGPIVRARDFIPQIRRPLTVTSEMFGTGVYFIVAGLVKKAIISDFISVNFVERVFDQPSLYSGFENLMAVYGYTLQIYCDFSGYSDMAIGLALLLGFKFPLNFNFPYKSFDLTDFWRRWHISLSSWIRDYVYISMGGNRKGKVRQYVNLIVTMLLCGLWHGASLNFILWGGIHGLGLMFDKIKYRVLGWEKGHKPRGLARAVSVFITFHFVAAAWVLFRCQTFEEVGEIFTQIFTSFQPQIWSQWMYSYMGAFALMVMGYVLHFLPQRWNDAPKHLMQRMPLWLQALVVIVVIFLVFQIKTSDVQPFIYFQF